VLGGNLGGIVVVVQVSGYSRCVRKVRMFIVGSVPFSVRLWVPGRGV